MPAAAINRRETMVNGVAKNFILWAVQDWGQPEAERIEAVQRVLNFANFDAKATCAPTFGAIWPKECEGPDGAEATQWLHDLTGTMQRGKLETEVAHVEVAIRARAAA
jgi:hypothetical protein